MTKLLLASVSLLVLGAIGPASAADMPAKAAPPPPVQPYQWTGFYAGVDFGGGWSRKCWDDTTGGLGIVLPASATEGCHSGSGGLAGGQIGYRWQSVNVVFGVEAQGDWASFTGRNPSQVFGGAVENRSKVDALGLFTGQIGYAYNNVLLYFKAGGAVTHDKYEGWLNGALWDTASETRWGGVVGAGFEIGFAQNWSVGGEYDHLFMGNRNLTFNSVVAPVGTTTRIDTINQDVDMFTVRVNYRFGAESLVAPLVTKF